MKRSKLLALFSALLLALTLYSPAFAADVAPADTGVLTRGAFVTALYGVSGTAGAAQTEFDDVPDGGELALAVGWAADNGITDGCAEGRFGPDEPVTREQMVTMLYRCAQALGQTPQGAWMFPLGFADADSVSAYADEAMQWAVMNRIIIGTDRGLEPQALSTQQQLSLMLERWEGFLTPADESRGSMILFTSDIHCGVDQGFGYAGLQEVRDALVKQGYDVILVDNGDNIQGEALGTMTKGEALNGLMNQMGYSVAIPGNHEFDYGMKQFLALAEKAAFLYVSCNFNYKGEPVFQPYVIRELGGRKVAFVGVTTPETMTSSTPGNFKNESGEFVYGFLQDATGESAFAAVQKAADAARAEGAELVVVMGHLGNETQTVWNYGNLLANTRGIDVMLDGHSHDTEQAAVKNADGRTVLRAACGTKLACIGWCSIAPDGTLSTGVYSWNADVPAAEKLGLDNEMSRAVAAASEELNEKLDEVVAMSAVELTINDPEAVDANGKPIRMVRRAETNLGDLCADAYLAQSGADVAFINGGGVRTSISAGDITRDDILSVFPFGNALCVIEVTGQQLLDALEWGAHGVPGENGGFLQVAGMSYEIRSDIESSCIVDENSMFAGVAGARRVQNVRIGGQPLQPEQTYTLAGHNFMLLENGDGYTMFDGAPILQNCVKLDNQLLIDYITETLGGVIGAEYGEPGGQGRIVITE